MKPPETTDNPKLGRKKQREQMLEQLHHPTNEQWALVELYRWEHGELPPQTGSKPLSVKNGIMKMAEAFADPDQSKWPSPANTASVLAYCSSKFNRDQPKETAE